MNALIQYALYLIILVALAIPLGSYIGKVMNNEPVFLSKILRPCEKGFYRILGIHEDEEMGWKKYAACSLAFFFISLFVLTLILKFQDLLPWNPQGMEGLSWHLAFNTASSFATNTNWQSYSGEVTLSNFSQAMGLTVQNFVSAGAGIAVLFALIRGFVRTKASAIGNFWVDLTRSVLYVMLPLSLVMSIALVGLGVPQSLGGNITVDLLEPLAVDAEGNVITGAEIDPEAGTVTLDGALVEDAQIITKQIVPLYPQASQVSPKQLGTNGGGILGNNSAHPLENPNPASNLLEMISLLLIPAALCFTFGRNIKDKRQGIAIFLAMFILLVIALGVIGASEQAGTPQLAQNGAVDIAAGEGNIGGNMEGKETRFGITTSSTWAAFTTAASNGSVNSMHDSYTPIGGMMTMLQMQLGEVIFGGVGCGLYGMIGFALLTVFIAGLMVGRTPEFLGHKVEAREMKIATLVVLMHPFLILVGTGISAAVAAANPEIGWLNNPSFHGLSEMLYEYTSAAANNGSGFEGLGDNTPFWNIMTGIALIMGRYFPIVGQVAIAGLLASKKYIPESAGTLKTDTGTFSLMTFAVIIIVAALSFFPAQALGPIADYLSF